MATGSSEERAAVLFFDVDGTLVWHRPGRGVEDNVTVSDPSAAVVAAFRRLRAAGHQTFICTGRPRCLVSGALTDLEPTGLITSAGASLELHGRSVFERILSEELVIDTARELARAGAAALFEGPERCVGFVPGKDGYEGMPDMPTVRDVDGLRSSGELRFSKLSFRNAELARLARIDGFLSEHYELVDLGLGVGEMSQIGVSKAVGVQAALERLGIDGARTFAFGDSENDLPMFPLVDEAIAMGNALDSVKAAATFVTDSVEDDGVVAALEHFGLV